MLNIEEKFDMFLALQKIAPFGETVQVSSMYSGKQVSLRLSVFKERWYNVERVIHPHLMSAKAAVLDKVFTSMLEELETLCDS